jgi:hypothetical protein
VIATISQEAKAPEARQKLLHHVCLIQAESQVGALIEQDRRSIDLSVEALRTTLKG